MLGEAVRVLDRRERERDARDERLVLADPDPLSMAETISPVDDSITPATAAPAIRPTPATYVIASSLSEVNTANVSR